jgi:hypothetical protein
MFGHFGVDYYGKVDVVPNLCHVATRFFHVNFVPVVPLGSWIVVTGPARGKHPPALKTGLSLKSILIAWLRTALAGAALVILIVGLTEGSRSFRRGGWPAFARRAAESAALALIPCAAMWLTYRWNRAGYERAMQLGMELGLEPDFVEQHLTVPERPGPEPAREPEGWERYC